MHLALGVGGALGDGVAEFAQKAAKGIDAGGADFLTLLADAVQLLELLLIERAHGDVADAFAAVGFEERLGIDAVEVIAPAVGVDVLGGDDERVVPGLGSLADSEVSGAAGIEQHGGGRELSEEVRELRPGGPVSGDDAVLVIGDGEFEDGLCQVDGDDIRLHGWTASVQVHSMVNTRMLAYRNAEKEREESISSLQRTANPLRGLSAAELGKEMQKQFSIQHLTQRDVLVLVDATQGEG